MPALENLTRLLGMQCSKLRDTVRHLCRSIAKIVSLWKPLYAVLYSEAHLHIGEKALVKKRVVHLHGYIHFELVFIATLLEL